MYWRPFVFSRIFLQNDLDSITVLHVVVPSHLLTVEAG